MSEKIYLTISPDYVMDWSVWEAVRELLQNAMDSSLQSGYPFKMEYHNSKVYPTKKGDLTDVEEEGQLVITSYNTSIPRQSLLMGHSKKCDGAIGKFGEGFKLALLVLTRLGKEVTIWQRNEVWAVSFEWSETFEANVLCVTVTENEEIDAEVCENDVIVTVDGFTSKDYNLVKKHYHPKFKMPSILSSLEEKGNVYVAGLFVTHVKELNYGYNFRPGQIPLNRDRNMSIGFNIKYEAARLHDLHSKPKQVMNDLVRGHSDLEFYPYHAPQKPEVVQAFIQEYPNTVPVATEDDIAKLTPGTKFKIVPQAAYNILHACGAFITKMLRPTPLHIRMTQWRDKVASGINS